MYVSNWFHRGDILTKTVLPTTIFVYSPESFGIYESKKNEYSINQINLIGLHAQVQNMTLK